MSIAASSLTPGDELAEAVAALLEQLDENPDREGLLSQAVTSSVLGVFSSDSRTRAEFLSHIQQSR